MTTDFDRYVSGPEPPIIRKEFAIEPTVSLYQPGKENVLWKREKGKTGMELATMNDYAYDMQSFCHYVYGTEVLRQVGRTYMLQNEIKSESPVTQRLGFLLHEETSGQKGITAIQKMKEIMTLQGVVRGVSTEALSHAIGSQGIDVLALSRGYSNRDIEANKNINLTLTEDLVLPSEHTCLWFDRDQYGETLSVFMALETDIDEEHDGAFSVKYYIAPATQPICFLQTRKADIVTNTESSYEIAVCRIAIIHEYQHHTTILSTEDIRFKNFQVSPSPWIYSHFVTSSN